MTDRAGDIVTLINKHIHNELTEQERHTLTNWIDESYENRRVFNELTNEDTLRQAMQEFYAFTRDHEREKSSAANLYPVKTNWFKYVLAAAAIIAAVCLIWLFALTRRDGKQAVVADTATKKMKQDLPPGGNKAMLTLADGRTIELDNASNGVIAEQGKTVINKKDGELVYNEAGAQAKESNASWNMVTTPRGGQYQLSLPDGSKVWLNAASSLKFPVSFSGKKRVVQLTGGEAYFEVTHVTIPGTSESMAFEVQLSNGMKVQVLGTRFNIMAYEEESETKTTLVQGKVKVVNEQNKEALLEPGQQALFTKTNGNLQVDKDADVAAAVAWKEGLFKFSHTDIKAVMRQLARWYDVQIEYDNKLPEKYFTGEISRRLNASEVLSVIEFAGVHCKIEGKKILVLP